jgi:hypothetical protein
MRVWAGLYVFTPNTTAYYSSPQNTVYSRSGMRVPSPKTTGAGMSGSSNTRVVASVTSSALLRRPPLLRLRSQDDLCLVEAPGRRLVIHCGNRDFRVRRA